MALLALVVLAPLGLEVKHAMAQDPRFCTNCHQMDGPFEKWAESAHSQVTCVECHPGGLASDLRHAWLGLVVGVDEVKSAAGVDQGACLGCHVDGDPRWPRIAQTAGHRVHHFEQGLDCVGCHGSSLHVQRPPLELCERCHDEEMQLAGMIGRAHCLDCHAFLADRDTLDPDADACLECHTEGSGTGAPEPEVHGSLDCLSCHDPHDADPSRSQPCALCHDERATDHDETRARCADCHEPHHPAVDALQACNGCHEKVPHGGNLACTDCHAPHAPSHPSEGCVDCHTERPGLHAKASHQQCLTCHRPHRLTPPDDAQCLACHEAVRSWHAETGCTGCHAFGK